MPDLPWLRPSLLDMYVGLLYLRVLALCLIGMAGLFYISTFIDLSDNLFKGTATTAMLLQYFWFATPQYLYYIIALAVLLAAIVTVGALTKSSELIVMRACGISLYRTAVPLLVSAALASAALFALEESLLGPANRRASRAGPADPRPERSALRRAHPEVVDRRRRHGLSLPGLQPWRA